MSLYVESDRDRRAIAQAGPDPTADRLLRAYNAVDVEDEAAAQAAAKREQDSRVLYLTREILGRKFGARCEGVTAADVGKAHAQAARELGVRSLQDGLTPGQWGAAIDARARTILGGKVDDAARYLAALQQAERELMKAGA